MDAGRTTRKFPSYTLSQLEAFVADGSGNEAIVAEIIARKAGASVTLKTPQVAFSGMKPATVLGRI